MVPGARSILLTEDNLEPLHSSPDIIQDLPKEQEQETGGQKEQEQEKKQEKEKELDKDLDKEAFDYVTR